MKIETTMRYHLTSVRMAIVSKTSNNKCWGGGGKKKPLFTDSGNVIWYSHYRKQYGGSSQN